MRDRIRERVFERSRQSHVFKSRGAEVFAGATYLGRDSFYLAPQNQRIDQVFSALVFARHLIREQKQSPQIGKRLIVKIARYAATFGFGLARHLHSSLGQLKVRSFQRFVRPRQSLVLIIPPRDSCKRQRQQQRQRSSSQRKGRALDFECD